VADVAVALSLDVRETNDRAFSYTVSFIIFA
jgi:hypothetical protein